MYTTEDGVIKLEVTFDHDKVENFGGLDTLKVEVGTGSVICMAADLLPIDEKNWYVPVWLI